MSQSSHIQAGKFKSPLRIVAGFLFRSRQTQRDRAEKFAEQHREAREQNQRLLERQRQLESQLAQANQLNEKLESENARLRDQPIRIPDELNLPNHSYGAKMISHCVNLAQIVGFRAAEKVLALTFQWLGVETIVPHYSTIRNWLCRTGVGTIEMSRQPADDWLWMADHSNQIGQEKVLVILGVRIRDLPAVGQPLRQQDMKPLAVIPAKEWKREHVAEQFSALAEKIGTPLAVIVDGAVELREAAETLSKPGKSVLVLNDFKHKAANIFKKIVGQEERFSEFISGIGRTRSSIQQTELSHFTPPQQKTKARFMNLQSTLRWAEMVLWHLSNPHAAGREGIRTQRMNEKLGWLRAFRQDVKRWSRCQAIISVALTLVNDQGLYVGAARDLHKELVGLMSDETSSRLAQELVAYVRQSEQQLKALKSKGITRLPLSTEILESSFGIYKQLERQHSKSGFTSLLAAFGGILRPATARSIKQSFAAVTNADLKQWVTKNLGTTLTAKKKNAYAQFASANST